MCVWTARWKVALAGIALTCCGMLAGPPSASAHEGPPFPILMDQPLADLLVSVWADPDIGEAQFFIIVESPSGGIPHVAPRVSMWVEPVSGRLDRVTCEAKRQSLRSHMQFEAKPFFDQRDLWTVGIRLTTLKGESQELTTQVESTPPGYGPWDLAIYLFPFLLLGGFWAIAMFRRSRMVLMAEPEREGPDSSSADEQADESRSGGTKKVTNFFRRSTDTPTTLQQRADS